MTDYLDDASDDALTGQPLAQNYFLAEETLKAIVVEVSVQDAYFDAETALIAESTWEQCFLQWLQHLQADLPPWSGYELSLRLTNDQEIQTLNAQYRQKDQPTDVLAFAALEVDYPQSKEMQAAMPLYLGDIVISVETATAQALERGHSLAYELSWLAAHGLLHLVGWDHPDEESLRQMLDQQDALLQAVNVTPGWQGTVPAEVT
jgi:probable rRNA maturation factor